MHDFSVSLNEVEKTFPAPAGPGLVVLDHFSLNVAAGERLAIMGPSGCGKSTLLNILGGLERPTRGEVFSCGQALHALNARQLDVYRLTHVAYVFQFFHLLPTLTLMENALLPAFEKFPTRQKDIQKRALQFFERIGLGAFCNYFPSQVSGGMQSRAGLCRALLLEPNLLLADEPTGNLDSHSGAEVLQMLTDYQKSSGCMMVLVSHDEHTAKQMSDRIVRMRDGKISS